jgi:hypothetical protein
MTRRALAVTLAVPLLPSAAGGWAWYGGAWWGALLLAAGLLFAVVRLHSAATSYLCPNCCERFQVGALTDFLTPHFPGLKYLRCPGCRKWNWAAVRR